MSVQKGSVHSGNEDPIRLGGTSLPADVGRLLRDGSLLVEMLLGLPAGVYEGANRYDTDDEHVLHLWRGGQSWDIRLPRVTA